MVVLLIVLAADRIVAVTVVEVVRGHIDATENNKRYRGQSRSRRREHLKTVEMTRRRSWAMRRGVARLYASIGQTYAKSSMYRKW